MIITKSAFNKNRKRRDLLRNQEPEPLQTFLLSWLKILYIQKLIAVLIVHEF